MLKIWPIWRPSSQLAFFNTLIESKSFFTPLVKSFHPFTFRTLLKCVEEEPSSIIFILTANLNKTVGMLQKRFFEILQKMYPNKIRDVFHVGHCLYGCKSCSISSHNIPLFFSRYYNGTLGLTVSDIETFVQRNLIPSPSSSSPSCSSSEKYRKPRVLVAPSVFRLSFLADEDFVSGLCSLITESHNSIDFIIKPHPILFHTNLRYDEFSDVNLEHWSIARLVEACQGNLIDFYTLGYSSLPAIEWADVVITDVESSLPFEVLTFCNRVVLAYNPIKNTALDPTLVCHYNVFSNAAQMHDQLLTALSSIPFSQSRSFYFNVPASFTPNQSTLVITSPESQRFVQSLYGQVDGQEASRLAASRNWIPSPSANRPANGNALHQSHGSDVDQLLAIEKLVISEFTRGRRTIALFASERLVLGVVDTLSDLEVEQLYATWREHARQKSSVDKTIKMNNPPNDVGVSKRPVPLKSAIVPEKSVDLTENLLFEDQTVMSPKSPASPLNFVALSNN